MICTISNEFQTNNERVAAEVHERGGTATAYVCDVSKSEDVKEVSAKVRREVGDIDILVNNAGILNGGALLAMAEKDIRRTMDINTMALFWVSIRPSDLWWAQVTGVI